MVAPQQWAVVEAHRRAAHPLARRQAGECQSQELEKILTLLASRTSNSTGIGCS